MIINKEEVEEFIKNLLTGDFEDIHIDYGARKGVKFAEEKKPKSIKEFLLNVFSSNCGYGYVRNIETYNDKLSISVCADQYLDFFGIKRK